MNEVVSGEVVDVEEERPLPKGLKKPTAERTAGEQDDEEEDGEELNSR